MTTTKNVSTQAPDSALSGAAGGGGGGGGKGGDDGDLTDMLGKLRAPLPSAQLLSTFLITVPFSSGFGSTVAAGAGSCTGTNDGAEELGSALGNSFGELPLASLLGCNSASRTQRRRRFALIASHFATAAIEMPGYAAEASDDAEDVTARSSRPMR